MKFRKLHAFGLGAIFTGVVAGVVVLFAPSRKIAPEPHLAVAARLPDAARTALATEMRAHAQAAQRLVSDATVLDWAATASAADALLAAPRVTPSAGGGAAAKLPERFFALQDELRRHAETVARTARAHDADGLAEAFASAAKTCVRCHDAYLTGR